MSLLHLLARLDLDEVVTHPVSITLLAIVGSFSAGVLATYIWRQVDERRQTDALIADLRTDVLPWFQGPKPGGQDESLPAQMRKVREHVLPNGGHSLSDRTTRCEEDTAWLYTAVRSIADHLGISLPPHPRRRP